MLYKAAFRYFLHDFPLAAVIGWTVCERALNEVWFRHLEEIRKGGAGERMPRERFDKLRGAVFTASIVTEMQELLGLLPHDLYARLNATRKVRNDWMHKLKEVTENDACAALQVAQDMIGHVFGLKLSVSISRRSAY